jgi:two-component system LytT family response regulator
MRAVIADDEQLARRLLREYLANHPEIEVVAECSNGFEAVKATAESRPDVLFLDIQMPKLDGFEVLELIDREVAVVFVTAFDQYAMRAFEAAAVDYLLKPFTANRLGESVDRLKRRLGEIRPAGLPAALRESARPPGQYLERIVVKDGATVHVIPAGRLDSAEAQDDYVSLRSEGRNWLKQQTITSLESALDPARFLRSHRSWIVNIERIVRVEPNTKDTWLAILRDGAQVPMSRAGYTRFRELIS